MTQHSCLWSSPSSRLVLSTDEVHVWRASLDQPESVLQCLRTTLSADEAARAARFHFERDRWRFTVARGVLRAILARYLDLAPEDIQFSYGPQNKPALIDTRQNNNLQFNLSHSQNQALYAFACNRDVGVDIEQIRAMSDAEGVARRFFSTCEYAVFQALPPQRRDEGFFNCWTRKEAYIKALGDGLSHPLGTFDVSLRPGEPAALLAVRGDPGEVSRWSMRALTPVPGYVAALVVEGHDWALKCWHWEA